MSTTEVPYDDHGDLMHRPAALARVHRWGPNDPFNCLLFVLGAAPAGRETHVLWRSAEGRIFPMFLADLVEMLQRADVVAGGVQGRWIVRKRGQRYGVAYLGLPESDAT